MLTPHPSQSPSLAELQNWMRWVITDPRGVDSALHSSLPAPVTHTHRYLAPLPDCRAWISDDPPLSLTKRLDIYAEAYFARILEVLGQDFSSVAQQMGEQAFSKIVAEYLKAHPSKTTNIGEIGASFPAFLSAHELTCELPWLSELAWVEWRVSQSFYADDWPTMDVKSLATVHPEAWPGARFTLDPSAYLLRTFWNADELWLKPDATVRQEERLLLIQRGSGNVTVTNLEPPQFQVLEFMQLDLTLEEICEKLADTDRAMPPLMEWFGRWITSGLIRKIRFNLPNPGTEND
jgi:hypothetical protein